MKLNTLVGMKREEGRAQSGVSAVQGVPRLMAGHSTASPMLLPVATWTSLHWTVPITHSTASPNLLPAKLNRALAPSCFPAASQSREVSARIGTKTPAHRSFNEFRPKLDFSRQNWETSLCRCGSCMECRQTCLFISHVNPSTASSSHLRRPIQTQPVRLADKLRWGRGMKLINLF